MKRVLCAVIVVIMLAVCGSAMADSTAEAVMDMLRTYNDYYKKFPSSFASKDEFIMYAYSLYGAYLYLSAFDGAYSAAKLSKYDGGLTLKMEKNVTEAYVDMANEPEEIFLKWLNGEVTNKECAEKLMATIDNTITSFDKTAGTGGT